MQGRAKSLNLPTHITIDAGRTQIAPSELLIKNLIYSGSSIFFLFHLD
jgi:peptidyl-tRNA hydrolase, PTH2 family